MLFRREFLQGIRDGTISLAFRSWRRPSVRGGGTLLTPVGQLGIRSVTPIDPNRISTADARRAGYESRDVLLAELRRRTDGEVFRIELGSLRPDPRIALREAAKPTAAEAREVCEKLRRLDSRATEGEWTLRTLEAIRSNPGVRAGDLCSLVGQEKKRFKLNVRKLKSLGLTESLETGYRLSPRGDAVLRALQRRGQA